MATINVWTGAAGDGNWNNAANWSLGVVPSAAQIVQIGSATSAPTVDVPDNAVVSVYDDVVNHGTIAIVSTGDYTRLAIDADVVLSGGGKLTLADNSGNLIQSDSIGSVLDNVDNTISGSGQIYSNSGRLSIINEAHGVIDATGANAALNINNISIANAGVVEGTGSAGLLLNTVTLNQTASGKLEANGGNVDMAGAVDVIGGTLSTSGGGQIVSQAGSNALDGSQGLAITITSGSTVVVGDNTVISAYGAIVNQGTIAVNSTGDYTRIAFDGAVTLSGGGLIKMTDESSNLIDSDNSGSALTNVDDTIEGAGQIYSNSGRLVIVNETQGVIEATGTNNVLYIDNISIASAGLLEATGAAGLQFNSMTLDQSAGGKLEANLGNVIMTGGVDVIGGTLSTATGAEIVSTAGGNSLDGSKALAITITAGSTVAVADNALLSLYGEIVDRGTIALDSTDDNTRVAIDGAVTLTGGGLVTMTDTPNNLIDSDISGSVLTNVDDTIEGSGQIYSNSGRLTIVNEAAGVIDATGTIAALDINSITITNDGVVEAAGAAGLVLNSMTLDQSGGGQLEGNGGNINLTGNVDVIGGTLSSSGAGHINVSGGGDTLDGSQALPITITAGSTVAIADNSNLAITGDIVDNGKIAVNSTGDSADLVVNGATTLSGSGDIVLSNESPASGGHDRIYSNSGGTVLDNRVSIFGAGEIFSNSGRLALLNDATGVIDAIDSNELLIDNININNDGVLESTAGTGGLQLTSVTVDNTDGGLDNSGVIEAVGAGTVVNISSSTLIGGTVSASGGGAINVNGAGTQFDSTNADDRLTITAGTTVQVVDGQNLTLESSTSATTTIYIDGTIALDSTGDNTDLLIGDGGILDLAGGGVIAMNDQANNRIYSNAGGSVLDNVDDTIEGSGQIFSNSGRMSIVNDIAGVIDATGTVNELNINNVLITNKNIIEATGAAGMQLTSDGIAQTSSGEIYADGANIYLNSTTITGGTLSSSGAGEILINGGGVALDGSAPGLPLTISSGTKVTVADSENLTLTTSSGASTIVNEGVIALASTGDSTDIYVGSGNQTVTLTGGGVIALGDSADNRIFSNAGGSVLDNLNNTIEGSGQIFSNSGRLSIINDTAGVIDATGTNAGLTISSITITNENIIEATGSAGLELYSMSLDQTSSGVVEANGANVSIVSTTIAGGALSASGGGAFLVSDGGSVLDGSAPGAPVTIDKGTTVKIADSANLLLGTASGGDSMVNQGTIALGSTGDSTYLYIGLGGQTVTLTGGGTIALDDSANNIIDSNGGGSILDNIDNTVAGAGQVASNSGRLSIVNETGGTFAATYADTALSISSINFNNLGTLEAENGATLSLASALDNIAADPNFNNGDALTGGVYEVIDPSSSGASTIAITGNGALQITTLDATVDLTGATSTLTSNGVALSSSLAVVGTGGALNLSYGVNSGAQQVFDDVAVSLTDSGAISLAGAQLQASTLYIYGGTLTGMGEYNGATAENAEVTGPIVNNNLIISEGSLSGSNEPRFILNGAVSGNGAIDIHGTDVLEMTGASGSGQTIRFENDEAGALQQLQIDSTSIGSTGSFQSAISGFAAGDAIDLENLKGETGYTFTNGVLKVTFTGGTTASLTLNGLTGTPAFNFTALGTTGTQITLGVTEGLAVDSSNGKLITNNATLTGAGTPGRTVVLTSGSTTLGSTTVGANGGWSFTPTGLADGKYTIVATEKNGSTVVSTASLTFTLEKDSGLQAALSVVVDGGSTTPITAAGAGAVSVSVSGLKSDDNGALTFSDGNLADAQTLTIVNGVLNQSSVNLSLMKDGSITSSLSITDAANNAFTKAGNTVTLDQGLGEQTQLALAIDGGGSAIAIGAAGASSIGFTIAGLESLDTGKVTFTDVNGKTVTVNITGTKSSYTANLSTLADGKITSSLLVVSGGGVAFTPVAGNAFTLDQAIGEQAALKLTIDGGSTSPIGANLAGDVAFTVAGLEAGDHGIVTFTDSKGNSVNVSVAGGQTAYDVNLSQLVDGAIASKLQVATDIGGNSFTPVAGNAITLAQDLSEQANLMLSVDGGAGAAPIGATGAASVAFTVAGLLPGDAGVVTFSDVNGHTVTVNVSASQTSYSVDLAGLADGTISSSLAVASDAAGNSFTPFPGNSVTLSQNLGEQGALHLVVGTGAADEQLTAANSSSVPFTVAGLATNDTGVVTFTNSSGQTVRVAVYAGQNSYTANLSSLGLGEVTSTLSVGQYVYVTNFTKTNDIQTNLIAQFPTGVFQANNSWATPFDITSNSGGDNVNDAGGVLNINTSIQDVTNVYTLMNAYSPPNGAEIATVEFVATDGTTETFTLVDGNQVRDFFQGTFANSINGVTTENAFSVSNVEGGGGTGNVNTGSTGTYNIDEQDFALDDAFASRTLSKIVITDTGNGGTSLLLGVTAQTAADSAGNAFLPVAGNDVKMVATPVQPPPPPPLLPGVAWGDVHLVTFDGLAYNFQAAGEFVLAESTVAGDTFQVQIRAAPYSNGAAVSVITQIAAAVGSSRVTFGLDRDDVVWINGVGQTMSVGSSINIGNGAGTLVEESTTSFKLTWATGEVLNVTDSGNYLNVNTTLASGASEGSVKGLLGSDSGQGDDFQLANGTVISNITTSELYGEFASSWRIPAGTQGLFDYGSGENTNNFTDLAFPDDAVSLANLPTSLVNAAQAAVAAAGITDPGLSLDAELDLIVLGNLGSLAASQNVQQSGVTTNQAQITGTLPTPSEAGVSAVATSMVESTSGTTAVTFSVYLTQAISTSTVITYAVVAPSAGYIGYSSSSLAALGGSLPTGSVTLAANATSGSFTINVPNSALGTLPSGALEVLIGAPQTVPIVAPTAQTVLINDNPVAGVAPIPSIYEVTTAGTTTHSGNAYTISLGNVVMGEAEQLELAIANSAAGGADNLGGKITDTGTGGFSASGDGTLASALASGQVYQGLYVDVGAGALGQQDEVITFTPVDTNASGYSASMSPITVTVKDNVIAAAVAVVDPSLSQPVTINLGKSRVGAIPSGTTSAALTIENAAASGAAALDASVVSTSNGITAQGSISGLAASGATSTAISVGVNAASGGAYFGTVTLGFASDAGSGNTAPLANQTVTVTGAVYQEARIAIAPGQEIIHVGDSTTQDVLIENIGAANGYSEGAIVSEVGLTSSSGLTGVAGKTGVILAGQSDDALQFQLASTATAGVYTGNLTVDLKTEGDDVVNGSGTVGSDGFGETDLGDTSGQIAVAVDNYAVAALEQTSGVGSLTQTGANAYTLNFGTVAEGAGYLGAGFGVLNDAPIGQLSDLLSGHFVVAGNSGGAFLQGALAEFTNLSAGQSDTAPQIAFSTAVAGQFSETITLYSTGSNASGYSGALTPVTLTVVGEVAPATVTAPTESAEVGAGGGSISEYLDVDNTESQGGLPIQAKIVGFSGNILAATGMTAAIAAGADDDTSLAVTLSTTSHGAISGTVDVDITQGPTDLGIVAVPVTLNVTTPAIADVVHTGGVGTLTATGDDAYTLNLGTATQGAPGLLADLGVLNAASSPSDLLGGSFVGPTGDPEYANGGFGNFSGFAAGQTAGPDQVELTTYKVGTFTETFTLDATSTNPSNGVTTLTPETVTVTGTILAPPPAPTPVAPTAVAWGDVHLTTFDGLLYNFQAEGEFTLARSTIGDDSYNVQIRLSPWSPGASVSVITQVAASVGDDKITFGLGRDDNVVYINGVNSHLSATDDMITLDNGAGVLTELSSASWQITWATGETLDVTDSGSYLSVTTALGPNEGAGSVQGLLGSDSGQANDFQLANGTVIPQPIAITDIYGEFADAWRVTNQTSMFVYPTGENTSNFTDVNFPADYNSLASVPASILAEAQALVVQAGITDPGLQQAAELDYIVTGNPNAVTFSQNVQQQGVTTTQAQTGGAPASTQVGVSAKLQSETAATTGTTFVTFNAYLTEAATVATTVNWAVTAPDGTFLGASAFGGTLPSGSVVIAKGATGATFVVDLPNGALGANGTENLQVTVSGDSNNDMIFAPTAQTAIVNAVPTAGPVAMPELGELSGGGTLTQNGASYTLNLGTVDTGAVAAIQLAVLNAAGAGADNLTGTISDGGTGGSTVTGDGGLPLIAAGQSYQGLRVAIGTAANGAQTETITFTPTDFNATGYTSTLATETLTIDYTVAAMPTVTVANFLANQTTLDAIVGGFKIADTAAAIGPQLDALDDPHINAITINANGIVAASVGQLTTDSEALGKLANANGKAYQLAISDTAADVQAGLATLVADAAHITSITATGGPVTVSTATFLADQSTLDKIAGGFAVADSATNVVAQLAKINADTHVSSLAVTSGSALVSSVASIAAPAFSVSGSGTAFGLSESLTYAGAFSTGAGAIVNVVSGDTLTLKGATTVGGSLNGAGALTLAGGATTIASGAKIGAASWTISGTGTTATVNESLGYVGAFTDGAGASLSISSGDVLTLAGATSAIGGTVTGAGTLSISGGAASITGAAQISVAKLSLSGASTTATINGNVSLAKTLVVGAGATLSVSSKDTLTLTGTSNISGAIKGAGTLFDSGGATALLAGATVSVADWSLLAAGSTSILENLTYGGTFVAAAAPTLGIGSGDTFTLSGTSTLQGLVSGAGKLALAGGTATIAGGAVLNVANVALSGGAAVTIGKNFAYAGAFTAGGGATMTISGSGSALTFDGHSTFSGATINGAGALTTAGGAGAATVSGLTIGGTVAWTNAKTVTETGGSLTLGDSSGSAVSLTNVKAGVYNITDNSGVAIGTSTASSIDNLGLLEKTGGAGVSSIAASVTDTGLVAIKAGTLSFSGATNSFAGAISGVGTLALAGGATTLKVGATLTVANFAETGATTTATIAENLSYAGAFTQGAGATATVSTNETLTLTGATSLSGVLAGAGLLATSGGTTTIGTGGALTIAKWSVSGAGAAVSVKENLSYAGALTLATGSSISVAASDTLTTKGATSLGGAVNGSGTLAQTAGATTIGTGAALGVANWSISGSGATATLNESLTYAGAFTLGTGATVSIATGDTLALKGATSLAGTIGGAGALTLAGDATTIGTGAKLTASKWSITGSGTSATLNESLLYAGAFTDGAGASVSISSGDTLTLDGTAIALNGAVTGAGTLSLTGGATTLSSATQMSVTRWTLSGASTTATVNGNVSFAKTLVEGAGSSLSVSSGDTFTLSGTSNLSGAIGGAGTLSATGGVTSLLAGATVTVANWSLLAGGQTSILGNLSYGGTFFAAAAPTLGIASSDTFTLTGSSTLQGLISGGGTLALSGGTTTIAGGALLNVANVAITGGATTIGKNLYYAGAFTAGAGATLTISGSGSGLTLEGHSTLTGVTINGAGALTTNGASESVTVSGLTIGGTVAWTNAKTATETGGSLTLGDSAGDVATMTNTKPAVYDILDNSGILLGASTSSSISNLGLLEKTGGGGTSVIAPNIANSDVILSSSGLLDLQGAISGTGAIEVSGGAALQLDGNIASTQTVSYVAKSTGEISLDDLDASGVQLFHGSIKGWAAGDTLNVGTEFGAGTLYSFTENSAHTAGVLNLSDGPATAAINFVGNLTTANFTPSTVSGGATLFTFHA